MDLDEKTKEQYQSHDAANRYHKASIGKYRGSLKGTLRSFCAAKFIADRERSVIRYLITQVPHKNILDAPCGTGKLAPDLQNLGSRITCTDISESMIEIAKKVYKEIDYKKVSFIKADLERASTSIKGSYDVVVCLRLMQRVTEKKRELMLEEFSKLSKHLIVSFAIENSYHKYRRALRRLFLGGSDLYRPIQNGKKATETIILKTHEILCMRPVARGLSSEWIYLLRSRKF